MTEEERQMKKNPAGHKTPDLTLTGPAESLDHFGFMVRTSGFMVRTSV